MISPQRRKLLEGLQEKIAVTFLNDALLSQSLTHSSYAHEVQGESKVRPSDNERLEFLGDAVLKVIISEYLYNKYPNYAEGDLTKIRATVVSDATLSAVAENQLELGTYLALGRNEKASGGAHRPSGRPHSPEAAGGIEWVNPCREGATLSLRAQQPGSELRARCTRRAVSSVFYRRAYCSCIASCPKGASGLLVSPRSQGLFGGSPRAPKAMGQWVL
mgnify:CR=1 FL=1